MFLPGRSRVYDSMIPSLNLTLVVVLNGSCNAWNMRGDML
jgi:hypothetical protein